MNTEQIVIKRAKALGVKISPFEAVVAALYQYKSGYLPRNFDTVETSYFTLKKLSRKYARDPKMARSLRIAERYAAEMAEALMVRRDKQAFKRLANQAWRAAADALRKSKQR